MVEISSLEFHFWQLMVLISGVIGFIWGREVGVKKGIYDTEKRSRDKH